MRAAMPRTVFAFVLLALACGGDSNGTGPGPTPPPPPPPPPTPADSPMTATLNGQAFTAEFATLGRSAGWVYINGAGLPSNAVGFAFADQGTGTYTIAPGSLVSAGVTVGSTAWVAGQALGSGTIVVTTFTASRIAGTFTINLVPSLGGPAMAVTDGVFDFTY
jgi:hypothetical protein